MKRIGICTVAKNENAYINEWVSYHIRLGFNHIWIYDNNDIDKPNIIDSISNDFKDYVTIIDMKGKNLGHIPNVAAYNDFLKNYSTQIEWCAFIDVDEFVDCNANFSLDDWLASIPEYVRFVRLYWRIYGDNNIIEGDETQPIRERFLEFVDIPRFRCIYKTFMRCNDVSNVMCGSAHRFHLREDGIEAGLLPPYYDCDFNDNDCDWNKIKNLPIRLNHYMTKSLSEFLKYKMNRVSDDYGVSNDRINYYFMINERTQEKEDYINEHIENM